MKCSACKGKGIEIYCVSFNHGKHRYKHDDYDWLQRPCKQCGGAGFKADTMETNSSVAERK